MNDLENNKIIDSIVIQWQAAIKHGGKERWQDITSSLFNNWEMAVCLDCDTEKLCEDLMFLAYLAVFRRTL